MKGLVFDVYCSSYLLLFLSVFNYRLGVYDLQYKHQRLMCEIHTEVCETKYEVDSMRDLIIASFICLLVHSLIYESFYI